MTNNEKSTTLILGILLTAALLAGCTPDTASAVPVESQPTLDIAALKAEIASTVIAEITQQAPAESAAPAVLPAVDEPTRTPWVITATADPAQQATVAIVVPGFAYCYKETRQRRRSLADHHPHLLHRCSPYQQSSTRQLLRLLPRLRL